MVNQDYLIWIEAEEWEEGTWSIYDDNTDVIVKFQDETEWIASFFTYANINKLIEKNKTTGECLGGRYFWSSDMILIDEISREAIEEVIKDLIKENCFESIFTRIVC